MVDCRLKGEIVKVNGKCSAGHHVGEEFDLTLYSKEVEESLRAPGICSFLYDLAFPYIVTLQFGGTFPWQVDKDTIEIGCPDNQKVVIRIKRIEK